jgi:uncharacterized RDD family membrane protein YckC
MSSVQLEIQPFDETAAQSSVPPEAQPEATPFALKQQVAERLAAHRSRHNQSQTAAPSAPEVRAAKPRTARIAAAVAERYAHSQSYRSFLAAEAERAIREARQAEAAAEVAARSAQAIANAQNELLAELDQWALTPLEPPATAAGTELPVELSAEPSVESSVKPGITQVSSAGLTVRLYEDPAHTIPQPFHGPFHSGYSRSRQDSVDQDPLDEEERLALEEEIAFRQSPVFDVAATEPTVGIPANLIEFPRQLVAPRRARPRIAEGPLREETELAHDPTQLRIFEVEPAQISADPVAESVMPEWSSILLGATPAYAEPAVETAVEVSPLPFNPVLPLQTADLSRRLMAGMVDGCIVLAAALVFTAAFALTLSHLPGASAVGAFTLQTAAIAAGGVLAILGLCYQALFFTFSEATPGMRYARIGLCTFNDENPTRRAMRMRIVAAVLSACPLGIGFLWAWLDDDRLGWHDRISRMYQRSY